MGLPHLLQYKMGATPEFDMASSALCFEDSDTSWAGRKPCSIP
jgi:hypothetical protein